jgi:hypothetical protein
MPLLMKKNPREVDYKNYQAVTAVHFYNSEA